jgi:hypothetical protein
MRVLIVEDEPTTGHPCERSQVYGWIRFAARPTRTVPLRLTLLYGGRFLVSGVALLATTYLLFRSNTGVDLIVPSWTPHGSTSRGGRSDALANPDVVRRVLPRIARRWRSPRPCSTWPATIRPATPASWSTASTRSTPERGPHRGIAPAQPRRTAFPHPRTRRPAPHGRVSHRNAPRPAEARGEHRPQQLVATLAEPFQRGTKRIRPDHERALGTPQVE